MPNLFASMRKFSLIATSALALSFAPMAQAELSEAQVKEFEAVIENYILENPDIIERALIRLQTQKQEEEQGQINQFIKLNQELIENPEGLFIGGNPDGDVTLIEFFDYNCHYCKISFNDVQRLIEEDKNLKVVMYELPILAKSSLDAARVSLAALKQGKYWEFHSKLINHQGQLDEDVIFEVAAEAGLDVEQAKKDMLGEEVEAGLIRGAQLAEQLKINGTPAFIIAGELHSGALGYDRIKKAISEAREKQKAK